MTLLAAGMSAEDGDTAAVAAMAATATTATATAAPVSLADHCRGCCLEMLTLLAVIYFLKSVLNFDVFSGPGSLRSPSKPTSWTHSDGEQTQQGDEDTGLQEEDQQSKASSDSDNVIAAESDEGDGDEGDNEITCDRSYEVSAWSEDPGGHTDTDSDDDDDDDDGDQVDTNITNLSDGSGEDLGDMSSHEFNAIDLSLEQDQEGSSQGGDDSEGEGEAGSLHQSVLDTEWYRQYAEYQATTDQGER